MGRQRFFHDQDGKLALWQTPNVWLIIWAASAVLRLFSLPDTLASTARIVGSGSLIVWALLEIFQGVNYFRRGLGAVVLLITVDSIFKIHL